MTNTQLARTPRTRVIVGAVVAAAVAVAGIGVLVAPWPEFSREPLPITAAPPAAASVATCGGPLLAAGRESAAAATVTDAAAQSVVSGASDGVIPASTPLSAVNVSGGVGPLSVTAEPVAGVRTDVAAAGSAHVAESDLRGYAASACTRASMESWLVGGSAATGAADLVVLANPGDVAARVTLTVYGAEGAETPTAGEDLRIAPGAQRVIPLAALALGEASPVIQVTAAEAPVRASLQASITRVLLPGGVDQIAPSVAPEPDLVIPGVEIAQAPGAADASEVPAVLRLLSPAATATATVTVWGTGGQVGDAQSVDLTAGVPLELDLTGLAVGTYAVRVASVAPLTGAVWSTTGFGEGSDFAWFTAADALTTPALVAAPAGPSPRVTLTSSSDADQQVQLIADAGEGTTQEVTVPAGRTVTVSIEENAVYRIVPGGAGLRAAVSYAGTGQLAGYPVPASDVEAASIEVFPR
ncbi:DUF5719 family protein [uncultured Microbacterium sp.]|uniref:DUF5719 family protein n=1 Tax=uncultured Microbacterium sp. TaxID=191216 RepID=UPI0026356B07|nr:DUF5719 family protein [uncultured Microbacterium sp.]